MLHPPSAPLSPSPRSRRLLCAAVAALLAGVLGSGVAEARSSADLTWAPADIFKVALRFVRVDRGCKVIDKDPDAAFVLFECEDGPGKPVHHGALELIATEVQGRAGTRAQITLADEPRYVELRFLELLERKLRDERGAAPPPISRPSDKPAPPTESPSDGGLTTSPTP